MTVWNVAPLDVEPSITLVDRQIAEIGYEVVTEKALRGA